MVTRCGERMGAALLKSASATGFGSYETPSTESTSAMLAGNGDDMVLGVREREFWRTG